MIPHIPIIEVLPLIGRRWRRRAGAAPHPVSVPPGAPAPHSPCPLPAAHAHPHSGWHADIRLRVGTRWPLLRGTHAKKITIEIINKNTMQTIPSYASSKTMEKLDKGNTSYTSMERHSIQQYGKTHQYGKTLHKAVWKDTASSKVQVIWPTVKNILQVLCCHTQCERPFQMHAS